MDVEAQLPAVQSGDVVQAENRLREKRGAMMIVSVLIATLTYQATLNPPGGFWQDQQNGTVVPGKAIKAQSHGDYNSFVKCNAVGLFASLASILLFTSAITIKRPITIWLSMLIVWVSVFSVAFSFFYGLRLIAAETMSLTLHVLLLLFICLIGLVLAVHMGIGERKLRSWRNKMSYQGAA